MEILTKKRMQVHLPKPHDVATSKYLLVSSLILVLVNVFFVIEYGCHISPKRIDTTHIV